MTACSLVAWTAAPEPVLATSWRLESRARVERVTRLVTSARLGGPDARPRAAWAVARVRRPSVLWSGSDIETPARPASTPDHPPAAGFASARAASGGAARTSGELAIEGSTQELCTGLVSPLVSLRSCWTHCEESASHTSGRSTPGRPNRSTTSELGRAVTCTTAQTPSGRAVLAQSAPAFLRAEAMPGAAVTRIVS